MNKGRILKLSEDRSIRLVLERANREDQYAVDVLAGRRWTPVDEGTVYTGYEGAFIAYRQECEKRGTGV